MADKETVLVLTQNLFFLPRIQNAAASSELEVRHATSDAAFWDAYRTWRIALIFVDLEGDRDTWTTVLEGLTRETGAAVAVVAYGPHADVGLLEQARKLGCDAVLAKSEFVHRLQELIETRGATAGG